ncbi:MAG: 2-C-methyl-D-erythritol 4-phosphate cytidylyltransferase [Deltaproteobacteria bacterium]|jgi:2-C-methyl-D-erythritol 4-phosphate cytidylyltransferase|nr:2-C-methyl-D-erythritol 4-phosphate cytidylyltransferase [Deltaproteobacteria bacterium]MBW2519756.1 2-C-methyl-D-erythritol 4-phosphate cytidylyltransferase [Deltaproteobacteria bacterium]
MNVHVLVPAAGSGKRLGSAISKQFLPLGSRPILAQTLLRFGSLPQITGIYLIVPEAERTFCQRDIVDKFHLPKIVNVVAGGKERQDSVRNGLEACNAAQNDIVLIHDGVRPFFPAAQIPPLIDAAAITGAAVLAIPSQDTVKKVINGRVLKTLDRSQIWQVQTPQAFLFSRIFEAHRRAQAENHIGTDDSALVEWCGWPVAVVSGSVRNFKITTQADLLLARALVSTDKDALL